MQLLIWIDEKRNSIEELPIPVLSRWYSLYDHWCRSWVLRGNNFITFYRRSERWHWKQSKRSTKMWQAYKEEKELENFEHWRNYNERIPAIELYSTSSCVKMLLEELISCLFCILSSSSWISFCLILILASITRCSS